MLDTVFGLTSEKKRQHGVDGQEDGRDDRKENGTVMKKLREALEAEACRVFHAAGRKKTLLAQKSWGDLVRKLEETENFGRHGREKRAERNPRSPSWQAHGQVLLPGQQRCSVADVPLRGLLEPRRACVHRPVLPPPVTGRVFFLRLPLCEAQARCLRRFSRTCGPHAAGELRFALPEGACLEADLVSADARRASTDSTCSHFTHHCWRSATRWRCASGQVCVARGVSPSVCGRRAG